ncbi:MAG: patatin-like phospholipase family protein [Flavobacteriaceae bacterium]|jgi:NTE family protein|nr:patatin-like phospholipase family protein [Flavobacteriaceae bacterium]
MKYFFCILSIIGVFNFSSAQDSLKTNPKVGLVLSGGGAKGFAHIEVLEALEKAGVRIDYIGGTSIGAIVGGLYAAGYSPSQIRQIIKKTDFTMLFIQEKERDFIPFFDKSYKEKYLVTIPFNNFKILLPSAISKGQGPLMLLTDLLAPVHQIKDFSQLPIPFFCIATNLENGEEEQLENGFLPLSILASGAFPTLVEPVKIGGKTLVDGGIVNNLPAKALKNKGMDIVIGVDLGAGLMKMEEMNSLIKIIDQIISYRINYKTDYERDYIDVLIRPDLKNYTVTDFNKMDSILLKGKIAAKKAFPKLEEIAKMQGYDTINRPRLKALPQNMYLFLNQLNIEGNTTYSDKYLRRKTNLYVPENTTVKKLSTGTTALYSTGNFNRVYYELSNNPDKESENVTFHLDEKDNNSVKLGIHYDDVYKAGLLTNVTMNRLLLSNATVSLDVVFGNNFRAYLNYFIDNGVLPSIGLNSTFNSFGFNYDEMKNGEYLIKRLQNFNQQVYLQSTLNEKYAVGGGMEYTYIKFSPFLGQTTKIFEKTNANFFNPYFYIQADTRDNSNFPSKGFKFNAVAKYIPFSDTDDFKEFYIVKGNFRYYIPLGKRLSVESEGFFGTSFNNLPLQYKYFLGGYFEQDLCNFEKFLGLPFGYAAGNHALSLFGGLKYRILKNHYARGYVNFANIEDEFIDLQYFKYKYSSYGIGYGYDSPFGPINLLYTYSTNQCKGVFSVALGYWF